MIDDKDLHSVPDASMASMFKGLVEFMLQEADNRGWKDVASRLQAVGTALRARGDAKAMAD